jgi:hypothetical protein
VISQRRSQTSAAALRRHVLQGRHDDMLAGANAETAANLLTRCLEAAGQARLHRFIESRAWAYALKVL